MGEAHFRTPTPRKPLNQFRCHVKYFTTSPKGVDVQNLVRIDSAVTDLRMREKKHDFVWIFFININVKTKQFKHGVRSHITRLKLQKLF